MTKFNISYSDGQEKYNIDKNTFIKNTIKLLNEIFKISSVIEDSTLSEYELEDKDINIDILICDNDTIQQINREYREKDTPTDVISFALFADNPAMQMIIANQINLGEIIISTEKVSTQSVEYNKSFDEELYFLLSHGILHLLGFDHPDEKSLEFMINLQNKLVATLQE